MEGIRYLDPELVERLLELTLRSRLTMGGAVAGLHRSSERGVSSEFSEHRRYCPGDDLRHLDWKVFARTDRFFVRQFEEETNLRAYLLLDASGSMEYGLPQSKLLYGAAIVAALSYVLLRQQDAPALLLFAEDIKEYVRPSSKPGHLQELLSAICATLPSGPTGISRTLAAVGEIAGRRSMIVVVSDFLYPVEDAAGQLRILRARGHDIAAFHVLHTDEVEFPFEDFHLFVSMEDDRRVEANPKLVRDAYRKVVAEYIAEVRRACEAASIDYNSALTSRPLEEVLGEFIARRAWFKRRVARI